MCSLDDGYIAWPLGGFWISIGFGSSGEYLGVWLLGYIVSLNSLLKWQTVFLAVPCYISTHMNESLCCSRNCCQNIFNPVTTFLYCIFIKGTMNVPIYLSNFNILFCKLIIILSPLFSRYFPIHRYICKYWGKSFLYYFLWTKRVMK